jgi:uncharacterized protein
MAEEQDEKFLDFLVKSIVDHPDDVKISRKVDEMGVLLSLKVHPEDMGQVIGRSGATARAIRALLRIVGLKSRARVSLEIEEPEGGRAPRRAEEARPESAAPEATPEPDTMIDDLGEIDL